MNTADKLLAWVLKKIEKEYPEDVALLLGYDLDELEHGANGGPFQYYKGPFDYFVPATEKGCALAKTFIIDGTGYDLYPRSWERVERMANLDDYNTCCLGDATILYSRSQGDRERFLGFQKQLQCNLENPEFMFQKALEKLEVAMNLYQTMMFEEALGELRMAAGYIADFLSVSVAFVNGTYFKHSQINQLAELEQMKSLPENFIPYYRSIISAGSGDELKNLSHLIIRSTRKFLNQNRPAAQEAYNQDFQGLADWYQELSYTWRRIDQKCYDKDAQKAFIWGCMLQHELDIVGAEYGLQAMDLLGVYDAADLSALHKRAKELEEYILCEIRGHDVRLASYATVEEFLAENR